MKDYSTANCRQISKKSQAEIRAVLRNILYRRYTRSSYGNCKYTVVPSYLSRSYLLMVTIIQVQSPSFSSFLPEMLKYFLATISYAGFVRRQ